MQAVLAGPNISKRTGNAIFAASKCETFGNPHCGGFFHPLTDMFERQKTHHPEESMNRRILILATLMAWPAFAEDRVVLPPDVVPTHYDIAVTPNAAALTFSGHVAIDIAVAKPTNTIKLNAADLAFAHVALTGEAAAPKISYDATQETATLLFAAPVTAGHHVLTIDYTGKINQHASGLFALDYDTAHGKKRALFTQFENSDARRFIPSWDEPARKATFTLAATVPANEMAVSNMPIAKTEPLAGGLARVHFATSPKMSSYLLFFGAGDFQRVSKMVNGVDVGVIFKRGDEDKAGYALDAAAKNFALLRRLFRRRNTRSRNSISSPGRARASSSAPWRIGAPSSISSATF